MKGCIKIGLRNNLIYILMLIIFNLIRNVDIILLDQIFEFNSSLIFIIFMFNGEFLAGLIIYKYQISFLPKKKDKVNNEKLIIVSSELSPRDNKFTIYFLIFLISFFDFIEFLTATYYIHQYEHISKTLEIRFSSFSTIVSALFYICILKFPIFKHQIFSLFIISICLIIILISECFQHFNDEKTKNKFFIEFLLVLGVHFFNSLKDSIEKYLLEFDFVNPFYALMLEGIIGSFLSIISLFIIRDYPYEKIKEQYTKNEDNKIKFISFMICLFIYLPLSGIRNAYRVATNKIYSPMTKTLTDYFLNPFFLIYYFLFEDDFSNDDQNKRIFYFILNLILSITIVFCSCIYNELLILYCYKLEHDTYYQVSMRALIKDEINVEKDENIINHSLKDDEENEN